MEAKQTQANHKGIYKVEEGMQDMLRALID